MGGQATSFCIGHPLLPAQSLATQLKVFALAREGLSTTAKKTSQRADGKAGAVPRPSKQSFA